MQVLNIPVLFLIYRTVFISLSLVRKGHIHLKFSFIEKNVAYLSPILYFYYSRKILIRVFFYECEIQSNCRSIVKSRYHTILKPLRCRQLLADLCKWFWCHTRYCSSTKYVVLNNWWLTIEVISMQLTRWWHQASIVFQFHYQEASCRQKRRKI